MIEVACCSTTKAKFLESAVGKKKNCPGCGRVLQFVAGEAMAEGAGSGDFDAALVADDGSTLPVKRFFLGGVADIVVGKQPECNIVLVGQKVSRRHCKLVRVDFGPSRWKIVDEKSTNGLFVNGKRISEQELVDGDGDAVTIGEFGFHYSIDHSIGGVSEPSFDGISEPGAGSRPLPLPPLYSSPARAGRNKLAIAGVVLGIVGVVSIAVYFFILRPAFSRARESANRIQCASQLHQIGQALGLYAFENHGAVPPSLDVLVKTEDLEVKSLSSPDAPGENYVLVATKIPTPADVVMVYEPISNHSDGANMLYGDGHIEWHPTARAKEIIADLENGMNSPSNNPAPPLPVARVNPVPSVPQTPVPHPPPPPPPPVASVNPVPSAPQTPVPPAPPVPAAPAPSAIVDVLPAGATKTVMVGASGGQPYVRVDRDKRLIIGFTISVGHWGKRETITRCEPLFTTPTDPAPQGATFCLAKDGYAVGGIIVNKADGADGLQIIFMKLKGNSVDVNDRYNSPWFGYTKVPNQTQLAGHGERVIGTFGRQGMNMDAVGLVVEPANAGGN